MAQSNSETLQNVAALLHKAIHELVNSCRMNIDLTLNHISVEEEYKVELENEDYSWVEPQYGAKVYSRMGYWHIFLSRRLVDSLFVGFGNEQTKYREESLDNVSTMFEMMIVEFLSSVFEQTELAEMFDLSSVEIVTEHVIKCEDLIVFQYGCYNESIGKGEIVVIAPQSIGWSLINVAPLTDSRLWLKENSGPDFEQEFKSFKRLVNSGYGAKIHALVPLYTVLNIHRRKEGLLVVEDLIKEIPWRVTREILQFSCDDYGAGGFDECQRPRCENHRNKVKRLLWLYHNSRNENESFKFSYLLSTIDQDGSVRSLSCKLGDLLSEDYIRYFSSIDFAKENYTIEEIIERIAYYEYKFCDVSWEGAKLLQRNVNSKTVEFQLKSLTEEFLIGFN
jgi:hypothetical protein